MSSALEPWNNRYDDQIISADFPSDISDEEDANYDLIIRIITPLVYLYD